MMRISSLIRKKKMEYDLMDEDEYSENEGDQNVDVGCL